MRAKQSDSEAYTAMQIAFGKRVRLARVAAGLTQKQLGELIDMADSSISNWERALQWTSPPDLLKLAKALNVTMEWLTAGEDDHLTVEVKRRLDAAAKKLG